MVFSSTSFLFLFLPITLIGYYLIRKELRNAFLLLMSLTFYAIGEPSFVLVMIASIIGNYIFGILLELAEKKKILKKIVICLTVALNMGILFYYKYFDFTIGNLNAILGTSIPLRGIVLPIGISFFTFQGLSYVLDIYFSNGQMKAQKNPLNVALYIALFPQLIAGPIVRYKDVEREIMHRKETVADFAEGVKRFSIGLLKKAFLANQFALLADNAFQMNSSELSCGMAWLGAIAYTFQIYYDFSGYSDMAIGLGRMFGFHFAENFNYPYTADSVTVFWRKWHISLSSYFRDYVYIPMGGNRRGNVYFHLAVVFLLTGVWHGASWNFVIWGGWHGFFIILERVLKKNNIQILRIKPIRWLYTMLVVVFGWVLFRANGLPETAAYLQGMFGLNTISEQFSRAAWYNLQDYGIVFLIGILAAIPYKNIWNNLCKNKEINDKLCKMFNLLQPLIVAFLLFWGLSYTITSTYNPFIYFNF